MACASPSIIGSLYSWNNALPAALAAARSCTPRTATWTHGGWRGLRVRAVTADARINHAAPLYYAPSRHPEAGNIAQSPAVAVREAQPCGLRPPAQCIEGDHVRVGQTFAHDQAATRPQHAAQLAQGGVLVGHLTQRGDQVGGVEGAIRVGQGLGLPLRGDDIGETALARPAHRDVEHLLLEVEDVERAAGKQPGCDIKGVVASAGADLQHPLAGARVQKLAQAISREERARELQHDALAVG